jgi:hypothetical protein
MSEDPIRRYSEATQEFEQAFARISEIASIINQVRIQLDKEPHVFMISNLGVNFPAEISQKRDIFTLDSYEWPSAEDLALAIITLSTIRQRLKEAWNALSDKDKTLVNKPDTRDG